jgi:hypothetical protein
MKNGAYRKLQVVNIVIWTIAFILAIAVIVKSFL